MEIKTKKIIVGLVAMIQLAVLIPATQAESVTMEKRKLLVTAYYSPLPNQDFYIRGSLAADIRLNGRGTNGADGTPVFTGMLAAPKSYPFGTRVKIPGLGVGEVHDRGGAILARSGYDRIDVWMGHGEEGLARALNWGARFVEGEVYFSPHQIEPGLDYSWVSPRLPDAYVQRLINNSVKSAAPANPVTTPAPVMPAVVTIQEQEPVPEVKRLAEEKEIERLEQNRTMLAAGLGKDSTGDEVANLQRMLWDLGYYHGEITGIYDKTTTESVFRFQVEYGVINSEWDKGAGYFGKKTFEALISALNNKIEVLAGFPKEVQVWLPAKKVLPEIAALQVPEVTSERQELNFAEGIMSKKVVQEVVLGRTLSLNDQSDDVTKLQNFLIAHGHLDSGLSTGYFGTQTESAVLRFQMEQGIISHSGAAGAGRVGPQTLATINSF